MFLGDPNVGKTCLARMFVDRHVLEESTNTIGFDHHMKEVEVGEGMCVKVRQCVSVGVGVGVKVRQSVGVGVGVV